MRGKIALAVLALLLAGIIPLSLGQSPATYYYVATAVDASGNESIHSNTGGPVTVSSSTPHVAVWWTASTSTTATGYNLYRATAAAGPWTKVNTALITVVPTQAAPYDDLPVTFPNPPAGLGVAPAP